MSLLGLVLCLHFRILPASTSNTRPAMSVYKCTTRNALDCDSPPSVSPMDRQLQTETQKTELETVKSIVLAIGEPGICSGGGGGHSSWRWVLEGDTPDY